jgi:hypothetical protein
MKADGNLGIEGAFNSVSGGDMIKASSRLRYKRSNLIQVIPTANKFGVLANLNYVSEILSTSLEGDITSRNFQNEKSKEDSRIEQLRNKVPENYINRRQPYKKLCNRPST